MKKVQDYFKTYPESDSVSITADGYLFHKDFEAATHAQTLKNKKTTTLSREAFEKQIAENPNYLNEELPKNDNAPETEEEEEGTNIETEEPVATKTETEKPKKKSGTKKIAE